MTIKSNFSLLMKLISMGLVLFLFFDIVSVLLGSAIIYFEKDFFPFSWCEVFESFFKSGYVGGIIFGIGIWMKIWLNERKNQKPPPE